MRPGLPTLLLVLLLAGCASQDNPGTEAAPDPSGTQSPSTAPAANASAPDPENGSSLPVNHTFSGTLAGGGLDNASPVGVPGCFMVGTEIFVDHAFEVPPDATSLRFELTWDTPSILYLEVTPAFGSQYSAHDDTGGLATQRLVHTVEAPTAGAWSVAVCPQGPVSTAYHLLATVT